MLTLLVLIFVFHTLPASAENEEFGGFGLTVAQIFDSTAPNNMGGVVILYVHENTEAAKTGLRVGDIIIEVDGKKLAGRSFEDIVVNILRGKVGSSSILKIKRAPENEIITVSVKRALIKFDALKKK